VSGAVHDQSLDETEEVRSYYSARILEIQTECDRRCNEYREHWESERKRATDLDNRFREVNARNERLTRAYEALSGDKVESQRRRVTT
jgi:hypothetical protein